MPRIARGGILQVSLRWNDVRLHAILTVGQTEPWWEPPAVSGLPDLPRILVPPGSHDLLIYINEQTLSTPAGDVRTVTKGHAVSIDVGDAPWTRDVQTTVLDSSGGELLVHIRLTLELPGPAPLTLLPPFRASDMLRSQRVPDSARKPLALHGVTIVRIFYATDRERTESRQPNEFYGKARNETTPLELGWCDVSFPQDHVIGELERPRWWHLEWTEDPERHVVLQTVTPEDDLEFFSAIRERVATAPTREQLLVFIHGYNVGFDDAMRRAAQIAHDLKFKGAAVAYSWPAEDDVLGYLAAEGAAIWTTSHFQAFLAQLSARSGASTIHLIGHSLGNRIMADALKHLSTTRPDQLPMFHEVILTAPDIDRAVFLEMADAVKKAARQVTIYTSSTDKALRLSAAFHRFARLGLAPPDPLVLPGVDTIDASGVDTSFVAHSYPHEASAMLADLSELIRVGTRAADRFGLGSVPGGYWEFRPRKN